MSDQQKKNELILLEAAVRRAEKQQMKEDTQHMQDVLKETMKKKKRHKSQDPLGQGDQDESQGSSLEALADDEDEVERMREMQEVDGMLNFNATKNTSSSLGKRHEEKGLSDGRKIIEAQKQQLGKIQNVNIMRQQPSQIETQDLKPAKKTGFDYKLDPSLTGSADNLIKAGAVQKISQEKQQPSKFGPA